MKTRKWPAICLALLTLFMGSCQDWGQMDPEPGYQVLPKLEQVANLTFNEELNPEEIQTFAYEGGDIPSLSTDETLGQVLHLPDGYARIFNPLNKVKVQNGVSLTFWVKQAQFIDEETEEALEEDLEGALFSFQNENGTQRMFMTANGWLKYEGVDGEYEAYEPSTVKSGMLTPPGEWHYVAVTVRSDGYSVYVDGKQRIDKEETNFDFNKIVQFMNNSAYTYIGYGSDTNTKEMWIDDFKVYRNQITDSQRQIPSTSGEFQYIVGDPTFTVGAPDNSAAWWTAFSNYFRMPTNSNMKFKFTNYTIGTGNWNNWCICICTDADRDGSGYAEYLVLRADLFGWGDSYASGTWTSEGYGDWDTFRADMNGAEVTVTVTRTEATVVVEAVAKGISGNVYKETFTTTCGDGTQVIRAFFIMDSSHIVFDTEGTTVLTPAPVTKNSIGAEDCSTAWWTEFSDYFTIPAEQNLHLEFENHTNGVGNWNNWSLCLCTDAERSGSGYQEYFVIRADLYGWGDSYGSGTWTNEGYSDDWDTFRADMEGAQVVMDIQRSGAKVTASAVATAKNGKVYKETFVTDCGNGSQTVRAFLIVDGAHLKLDSSNCYLYTPLFKK